MGANAMPGGHPSRRDLLHASMAVAAGMLSSRPLAAAAPEPSDVTAALVEAARREGQACC